MLIRHSAPPDLPDEIRICCFASRLLSLPLTHRPSLATPEAFRLFTDILTKIPPPPLVDAICLSIDASLRQPNRYDSRANIYHHEQINADYAAQVCTPVLAKALCDLVALGPDYASPAVFSALRLCMHSTELQVLIARDSEKLLPLSMADESGQIRCVAHEFLAQRLLRSYAVLPFPKPDFPLEPNCFCFLCEFVSLSFCRLFPDKPFDI
jgi:hypothetical protein